MKLKLRASDWLLFLIMVSNNMIRFMRRIRREFLNKDIIQSRWRIVVNTKLHQNLRAEFEKVPFVSHHAGVVLPRLDVLYSKRVADESFVRINIGGPPENHR